MTQADLKNRYSENPKDLITYIIKAAKIGGFVYGNVLDETFSFAISSFNPETGRMAIVVKKEKQLEVLYDSIYILFFDIRFASAIFGESWPEHLVNLAKSNNKLNYILNNITINLKVA